MEPLEFIAIIFGYSFVAALVGMGACFYIDKEEWLKDDLYALSFLLGVLWPISLPIGSGAMLGVYCVKRIFKKERL